MLLPGPGSALGASVGVITELEGAIELIREGEILAPTIGVEVREGDLLRTQAGAYAQLEMDDGSILNAGESSELFLSDYQLEPNKSVQSAVVGVLKGWLRFVTAAVSPRGRYEISTGTATIGIRGTEGIVREDPEAITFQLVEGSGRC